MGHLGGTVSGPRPGRMRSRRGRGLRGPVALPGPLSATSVPVHRTPRERFDLLVAGVVSALDKHFAAEPEDVDVVVEDVPLLPAGWDDPIPHGAVVRSGSGHRVLLYRLPMTQRCDTAEQLEDLVWGVLLQYLAEAWEVSPEDIDPRP